MKTAIIIGSTGLVGSHLLHKLLDNNAFDKVISFSRRPTNISHPKIIEHVISFNKLDEWKHLVKGDVLFSTLGTTLKTAGSKSAQYEIDYTYQYEFAKIAADNGVLNYVLVSSTGANADSNIFYLKIKGELEQEVSKLNFLKTTILKPGQLDGNRKENRPAERMSLHIVKFFNQIGLFRKYRPIHANIVAQAMINGSLNNQSGLHIYELEKVFELAEK